MEARLAQGAIFPVSSGVMETWFRPERWALIQGMQSAALQLAAAATPRGVLERLFTLMFQGFVYNQIWEDPSVDLDALKLRPLRKVVS